MDAFFAAVEQRDNPKLRGRALVIGGAPTSRSVVCTASYEARKFGIHSAMPSYRAAKLCPHAIFLSPNGEKYKAESAKIFNIFKRFSEQVEMVSIDEAYIDVTENLLHSPSATQLAIEIKKCIFKELNLTASAGVSYNKFLAKMASERRKPDGLSVIPPSAAHEFLQQLSIEKFHGIGKVSAQKFHKMGVKNGSDLMKLDRLILKDNFGKVGDFYYDVVRGIDLREVETTYERKSFGREKTLSEDVTTYSEIRQILTSLSAKVASSLLSHQVQGKTINLKLKDSNFQTITRATTLLVAIDSATEIYAAADRMLSKLEIIDKKFRLVGVSVSNLVTPDSQPPPPIQLEFDLGTF